MKDGNNNSILTIIAVLTLLVAIIGASFAYFSATSTSTEQDVTTGTLSVVASSTAITETNIKPTIWDDNISNNFANTDIAKLPFSVNTTGTNISSEYDIFLTTTGVDLTAQDSEGNELTGGSLSDVKWTLIKDSDNVIIASGDFTEGNYNKKKINVNPISIVPGIDSYKLLFYILENDNAQDKLQNVTVSATVAVEGKQK